MIRVTVGLTCCAIKLYLTKNSLDSWALWTRVTGRSTWIYSYTIQDGNKSYSIADLIICSLFCTLPMYFSKLTVNVLSGSNCLSLNVIYCRKPDYFLRMLMGMVTELGVMLLKHFHSSSGSVTEPRTDSDVSESFPLSGPWPEGNQWSLAKFGDGKLKNERRIRISLKMWYKLFPTLRMERSEGEPVGSSCIYPLNTGEKWTGDGFEVMQSLGEVLGLSVLSLFRAVMCPTMFIPNMNTQSTPEWLQHWSSCIHTKNQELSAQGEGKSAYRNHQKPAR